MNELPYELLPKYSQDRRTIGWSWPRNGLSAKCAPAYSAPADTAEDN